MRRRLKFNKNKFIQVVCTVGSMAGVVGTAVLSSKNTLKMKELSEANPPKTKKDKVKMFFKAHWSTMLVGVGTMACIGGSAITSNKAQASLTASYALLNHTYNKYQSKVKEMFGKEAHEKILNEMNIERAKHQPVYIPTMVDLKPFEFDTRDEVKHLFYEPLSDRLFESTFADVLTAEYMLNRNHFVDPWRINLNDFYTYLGIEPVDSTEGSRDWTYLFEDTETGWIEFTHHPMMMADNLECYVIEYEWKPEYPMDKLSAKEYKRMTEEYRQIVSDSQN